ncbi:androgen-induced gene 1 protein-like isoform X2 [Adelges cooleyi]|uniref:androgen-induced gene 1 protein-like isoform X2 n=1 Tax=Adelges cooleyi TaxID=133065 RepID=UPI00217F9EC7|nr:androgen-induced gene 1 protein-like isoform X2 [Adelges cooleyi]
MGLSGYLPVANVAVHLVASVTMVYSVYYNYAHVNIPAHVNPIDEAYGGKFKYLTFLDGCFSALFFTYALVVDICSMVSSSETPTFDKLSQVKSYFFTSIAFPLSMFVSTTFWSLWFLDRNLVMPKNFDIYFPSWLNHTMHTFVFVFACLEMITAYRPYPSRVHGLGIHLGFQLIYLVWIHIVYSQCSMWVYPILSQLNMLLRWLFFLGTFVYTTALYLIGEYVNLKLWGFQPQKVQEKQQ